MKSISEFNIKMVDLHSQYLKLKEEIDCEVMTVIDKSSFINGDPVCNFQNSLAKYLSANYVTACGNGTDAIMIALMALNLQPGDEIITSTFSFISAAETATLLGLKVVFVDIEGDSFNIDADKVEKAVTSKTKAIIAVHLFGMCCNMDKIIDIAKIYNLYLIEDACQSLGADYFFADNRCVKAGTVGHIGCYSFFPSKNLGCFGDGGAIVTNDSDLAYKISLISNHGMKEKYHHEIIGVNSRLDSIQAAILNVKLKYLDDFNFARQKLATAYNKMLSSVSQIITPVIKTYSTHIFHQYTLVIKENKRDLLRNFLADNNVPSMIYYPVSLHLQKCFSNLEYCLGDFPVSEQLSKQVLSLPICPELSEKKMEYICSVILGFFKINDSNESK